MSARRKKPKVVTAFMARRLSDDYPALSSVTYGGHSPVSIILFVRRKDARLLYGADYRIARVEIREVTRKGKRT